MASKDEFQKALTAAKVGVYPVALILPAHIYADGVARGCEMSGCLPLAKLPKFDDNAG